jgi:hypothetical protein
MSIEVDGRTLSADVETLHLAINVPAPELGVPAARPVS